jgi:hypothetical protein
MWKGANKAAHTTLNLQVSSIPSPQTRVRCGLPWLSDLLVEADAFAVVSGLSAGLQATARRDIG